MVYIYYAPPILRTNKSREFVIPTSLYVQSKLLIQILTKNPHTTLIIQSFVFNLLY